MSLTQTLHRHGEVLSLLLSLVLLLPMLANREHFHGWRHGMNIGQARI